jgi:hypothetical protein
MAEHVATHEYQRAARALNAIPGVVDTQLYESGDHPQLDRGCIEITVGPDYERVPPRVLSVIREHGLGLRPDLGGRIGEPAHFVVVVT